MPTFLHETPTPTQIPNVLKRRKRNTTRHATTNFIHLIGKGSSDSTTQVGDTIIFKWQKREHRRAEGFTLLPNAQDTSSIKILNSGVYLVYSQVAVHGRSNNNVQFYCSHNMQLKKGQNGPTSNILSSLLTQDNRGLEYLNMSVNGLKPLDTQLHMGVFFLLPEDELSVRIPPSCASTNYSTVAENSYFGVVKIG
ncbi:unnamed protein product [Candidula unifasciata]|uniref:THD domain-containing protein n=1 Tax=Candidula unifasciata TaxID=100452 RepID=A0A8S3YMP5_9EUPU|nr:unnamed protein product [Candidula unifasciata]